MSSFKIIISLIFLFLSFGCIAQKNPREPQKETDSGLVSLMNEIFFIQDSVKLDKEKKSKEVLDYLGRAILGGGDELKNKFNVFLMVLSNKEETNKNKFLGSDRVTFILSYLKEKYNINSDLFIINFRSTDEESSFISFSLIKKIE